MTNKSGMAHVSGSNLLFGQVHPSGPVRIRGRNQKHVPYSSCLLQLLFAYLDTSTDDICNSIQISSDSQIWDLRFRSPVAIAMCRG